MLSGFFLLTRWCCFALEVDRLSLSNKLKDIKLIVCSLNRKQFYNFSLFLAYYHRNWYITLVKMQKSAAIAFVIATVCISSGKNNCFHKFQIRPLPIYVYLLIVILQFSIECFQCFPLDVINALHKQMLKESTVVVHTKNSMHLSTFPLNATAMNHSCQDHFV